MALFLINLSGTNLVVREGRTTIEVGGHLLLREGEETNHDLLDAVDRGWAKFAETAPSDTPVTPMVDAIEKHVTPSQGMTAEELKEEKASAKKGAKPGKVPEATSVAEVA